MNNCTLTISPPTEFMLPKRLEREGYWSERKEKNGYLPIVSKLVWKDKAKFCKMVEFIESYLESIDCCTHWRGMSPSRLVKDEYVGRGKEYDDPEHNIGWPEGYVKHYIVEHNVMPTKEFYEYVVKRIKTIPSEFTKD